VTEPGDGGADSVVIDGSPAVIAADTTSQVTITNTFGPVIIGSATAAAPSDPATEVLGATTDTLPFTGSAMAGLVKAALWLLGIGAAALAFTRQRRRLAVVTAEATELGADRR